MIARSRAARLALAGLAALALLAALQAARAYHAEWRSFHPHRARGLPVPPGMAPVEFASLDGTPLRGWFSPSKNGAAVVLVHGAEADRRALLPEATLLAGRGYGALLFDLPGHGESGGQVHFAAEARAAVRAAAAFVAARPGVDKNRVAAFGFSMGGYAVAQVAPGEHGLKALILAGTPTDGDELTRYLYRRLGALTQLPALWADRNGGFTAAPTPLSQMPAILQPVLVVAGARDTVVPRAMAERLASAAGGPSQFLVVPGAAHGDYLDKGGPDYARTLLAFLDRWLG